MLGHLQKPTKEALKVLSESFCEERTVLPFEIKDKTLRVYFFDALDCKTRTDVVNSTKLKVQWYMADPHKIRESIAASY